MADRGRRVREIRDQTLRELLLGGHRLIYEVAGADVYVLALVHGARDLERLWDDEPRSRPSE
jgi:plasmid stabilization system protein ParE